MSSLFRSGRIVDFILVLTCLEAFCVVAYRARTGRGPEAAGFLVTLLAGFFLLLALRCALGGAWFGWVAACLVGALMAHSADVLRRWK